MPRRRFAVALVPPTGRRAEIDALRRLLRDPGLERLGPHLTLIPPVNLPVAECSWLWSHLRTVAGASSPFELRLGPAASFAPATPTLHLSVGGDLSALAELRRRLRVGPLDRPEVHDFVPHVTLREHVSSVDIAGAVDALDGVLGVWPVASVVVLEQFRDDRGTRWRSVREEPLGGPVVVGRGGLELHLRTITVMEPDAAQLLDALPEVGPPPELDDGAWVTVAETPGTPGELTGVLLGRAGGAAGSIEAVVVRPEDRRCGVGARLVDRWCSDAAAAGVEVVSVASAVSGAAGVAELMASRGFEPFGDRLVRLL